MLSSLLTRITLGSYKMSEDALRRGVQRFDAVDVAKVYGNEKQVGEINRSVNSLVFTKLAQSHLVSKITLRAAVSESAHLLGRKLVVLVHGVYSDVRMVAVAEELERMKHEGLILDWGVSNFDEEHLLELLRHRLKPCVNQFEFHPRFQRLNLVRLCKAVGIIPQAYRVIAEGNALQIPQIQNIAKVQRCSPAHVIYSWMNTLSIPAVVKASTEEHQQALLTEPYTLCKEELEMMTQLHLPAEAGRTCRKGIAVKLTNETKKFWRDKFGA